ncbi:MAG: hypothetical protein ISS82_00730 [Nanoarchaeota archaeon]|nr:hypothetical protein [Nanoarchaeota archaeon]
MNNKKRVILLFLILLFLPLVKAFELTSIGTSESTCAGSTILFTSNVFGTGDFTINLDGTASSWATAVPQGFSIINQNKNIYLYVTPPSSALPGNYNLNLIVSNNIETETINYNVDVNNCHNMVLTGDLSKAICACNLDTFSFNLLNAGNYQENYNLNIQGSAQNWITLSENSITLAPNEQKTIYAYANIPCNTNPNNYGFTLSASNPYVISSINSNIEVQNCFDFDLITNKDYISMCDHAIENIVLTINNKGSNTNKFFIELDGPLFANPENHELIIDGLQSKTTSLIFSPDYNVEGNFNTNLKVRSDYGNIQKQKNIIIDVRTCNSVLLEILENHDRICSSLTKTYQAKIKNTGELPKQFKLETSELWAQLDTILVNLQPSEELDFNIEITPPTISGNNKVYVKASALDTNLISSEDYISIDVISSENCYKPNIQADNIEVLKDNSATLPVIIENKGSQPATYNIAISGTSSSFIQLNPAVVSLEPGKSEIVYLYIAPSNLIASDIYKATISVILDETILEAKTINIHVKEPIDQITGQVTSQEPSINFFEKIKTWLYNLITIPIDFTDEKLITQDTDFIFDNEEHSIKIQNVNNNSVTILIESNPVLDTLNVGETKEFDINNDGILDLRITLESIIEGIPQLKIIEIPTELEQEIEEIIEVIEEEPIDELEDIPESLDEDITAKESIIDRTINAFNSYKMYLLYVVIAIIVIIILIILFKSLSKPSDEEGEEELEEKELEEPEEEFDEDLDEEEPLKIGRWIVGIIILAVLIYLGYKFNWLTSIKNLFIQLWNYVPIGINYLRVYKYYILIGLIILLIITLIIKYWKSIIDFFEEEEFEEEKPKKTRKKKKKK